MSKAQDAGCEGFSRQQNKSQEREKSSLFKGAGKQGTICERGVCAQLRSGVRESKLSFSSRLICQCLFATNRIGAGSCQCQFRNQ